MICKTAIFVFSTRGHLTAVEYMFKKYIEKLRTHDPACPLCHRPFDEQTEVDELISEARIFAFTYQFVVLCHFHYFSLVSVRELVQN